MDEEMRDMSVFLAATDFLDYDSHVVRKFVEDSIRPGSHTHREKAIDLYYAIRDGIAYDVYGTDFSRRGLKASSVVRDGKGFCVHKSILYAAAARGVGIPSKLEYSDVRNHLSSPRLRRMVGGDLFHHAYVSVYLNSQWVKATPVFNELLCRMYKMKALTFDGLSDSVHHPFDLQGRRHMEFVRNYESWNDVRYSLLLARIREKHPRMFVSGTNVAGSGSLLDESGDTFVDRAGRR